MKFSKGEQIFIYRSEHRGTEHKAYLVNVQTISKRYITAIDLGDNNIEKTFNTSRFLEILDKNTSDDLFDKRLKHHIDNYLNRELPSSFTHGGFFYRAKGYVTKNNIKTKGTNGILKETDLILKIAGSKSTMERDIKIFKLLIYYFQETGPMNMSLCKKFIKKTTDGLMDFTSDYIEYDDYNFTAQGKKDLIDEIKTEITDNQDYLKDLIETCKEEGENPESDIDIEDIKKEIDASKKYLKTIRSDYRSVLINFFCREYYHKYEDSIFFDIEKDFPINSEDKVTE